MKTFPASAAGSRHTRESGCPVATRTGAARALPFANLLSCAMGWRWMPAFAGMTSATFEMAMPVNGQALDLSTFEQNTL
ncbi:hypothetical protein [Vandammella animalimorsus]|uniref:hypothetical protein n=1 Tax=Vandammella animalimorsus TaxID=2029117 RepID=UPI00117F6D18|nr:hypothetical protein [Vandammella animalimorsus]